MRSHYRASDITQALVAADVRRGDTIFSHISLLKLGLIGDARTPQEMVATFTSAITNILGPEGCFITPSYSYSFCKGEPFNLSTTPSDVGPFSNQLRRNPKYNAVESRFFLLLLSATSEISLPTCPSPASAQTAFMRGC